MAGVFLLALGMGGCVIREQQSASKTAETEALFDKLFRLPKKGFIETACSTMYSGSVSLLSPTASMVSGLAQFRQRKGQP